MVNRKCFGAFDERIGESITYEYNSRVSLKYNKSLAIINIWIEKHFSIPINYELVEVRQNMKKIMEV